MRFVAFRPMPFERLLRSNEAEHTAPAPAEAWLLSKREGSSHSLWTNPATGAVEAIPRHTEISNLLARKICRNLSIPEIGEE
jgi:hypothetical protein